MSAIRISKQTALDRTATSLIYPAMSTVAASAAIYLAIHTDGFLSISNARAILASVGVLGVVAVGMTLVTISGNLFSLALGNTVVVSAMLFLGLTGLSVPLAILLTLLVGGMVGAVQGFLVGSVEVNPIIVTIAFGALSLGVAAQVSDNTTVYPDKGADLEWLAATYLGLPLAVFVLIFLMISAQLWLKWSRLGHEMFLVGASKPAARAGALSVGGVAVTAFAMAGMCAALGGVLLGGSEQTATLVSGGDRFTYDAIAAVLVGGAAVAGGRGAPYRSVAGVVFIATVSDLLLLRGFSQGTQMLVTGLIVLIVVITSQLRKRRSS